MRSFEQIIGLMHGNGPGSSTLLQHVSAMKMDTEYAFAYNKLLYALTDARKYR